jgi:AraC family transcriptional regulator, transcriptional activator of pobA
LDAEDDSYIIDSHVKYDIYHSCRWYDYFFGIFGGKMKPGLHQYHNTDKPLYHFSFLRDIKVHGIYFNSFEKFLSLYCFIRKEHAHDFYSIILFTRGSGSIKVNNDSYPIQPQTICIVAPNQMHSFEKLENVEGTIFFFCQDFYVEEFSFIRLLNVFSYTSQTGTNVCNPCIGLTDKEYNPINNVISSIQSEYDLYTPSNNSAVIIRSHLNIMLLKLSELYEYKSGKSNNNDSILIHSLSHLVDSYFIKEQHLGFYTSACNISENQLNDICHKHFNCSMKKILQNRLMQEARKLLLSSDLSVSEIAYKLNFEDNSYFNKVFKSKIGLTPKRFRDIHKKLLPQKA